MNSDVLPPLPRWRVRLWSLAAVLIPIAAAPAAAEAATVGADLRVLATNGTQLADVRQYTSTVTVPTDPGAACFGPGSNGSGRPFRIDGATALGIVKDAAESRRALRPLSLTDAFPAFGLGVCGIGGHRSSGSSFWYLKVDHRGAQVSGSQLHIRGGDDVLWYLSPGFPPPLELELKAPARAQVGSPFPVQVFAYDDTGKRQPVAGATVLGGARPVITGGAGTALVTFGRAKTGRLIAVRAPDIQSASLPVCAAARRSDCPPGRGRPILGSNRADRIRGTAGPDRINARGGADRLGTRDGEIDRLRCGRGADTAKVDRADRVRRDCERVIRLGRGARPD